MRFAPYLEWKYGPGILSAQYYHVSEDGKTNKSDLGTSTTDAETHSEISLTGTYEFCDAFMGIINYQVASMPSTDSTEAWNLSGVAASVRLGF